MRPSLTQKTSLSDTRVGWTRVRRASAYRPSIASSSLNSLRIRRSQNAVKVRAASMTEVVHDVAVCGAAMSSERVAGTVHAVFGRITAAWEASCSSSHVPAM